MPAMDKKQRKARKRREKNKRMKMHSSAGHENEVSEEAKKFGAIQLGVFIFMALAGAVFIVVNV